MGETPLRVHVVEDDEGVSDSLGIILVNLGHEVVLHRSAESLFAGAPPTATEAVIVDLSLPGISGAQAIRWLLQLATPPHVVVITGQSQSVIDHQLRGLAPTQLMRKPLDFDTISMALSAH